MLLCATIVETSCRNLLEHWLINKKINFIIATNKQSTMQIRISNLSKQYKNLIPKLHKSRWRNHGGFLVGTERQIEIGMGNYKLTSSDHYLQTLLKSVLEMLLKDYEFTSVGFKARKYRTRLNRNHILRMRVKEHK
jgi:hypothetical protein